MKSEKILLEGKEFYIDMEAYVNPKNSKLFLFKDPALIQTIKDSEGQTRMILKDQIKEAAGAGYAVWGGGAGGNYGNPGRGIGFGQSSNKGGPNLMYTYDIKPLNQVLQQPPNSGVEGEIDIHSGSKIKGKILGKNKWIEGIITSIEKDGEGNILAYILKDQNTALDIKIDPTSAQLLKDELPSNMVVQDRIGEQFYPSLKTFKKC